MAAIGKKYTNEEKKTKKLTKILIIILSVALVCTGLVMVISADGGNVAELNGVEYDSLSAALNAIPEGGGTVRLIGDAVLDNAYSVVNNVTIELDGYTLTADASFSVDANATFTVKGYGNIVSSGTFIETKSLSVDPVVNILGTEGIINMKKEASSTNFFIYAATGTYNFTNVKLVSETMHNNGVITMADNSKETASFNIKASEFVSTGITASNQSFFRMGGKGCLNVDTSLIQSDGTTITTAGTQNTTANYIKVTNSYIKSLHSNTADGIHSSAFGAYSELKGTITIENSVVESTYRPFIFANDNLTPDLFPNAMVNLVSSVVKMNAINANIITRNGPVHFDSDSVLLAPDTIGLYNNPKLEHCRVFVEEGMRTNSTALLRATENNSVDFPDGSRITDADTSSSGTYKFIYDPIGNPSAPYKVVALKDADGNAITPEPTDTVPRPEKDSTDYLYFGNGSDGCFKAQPVTNSVVNPGAGDFKANALPSGSLYNNVGQWWNQVGEFAHVTNSNMNSYFAYRTSEFNKDSANTTNLAFGQPLNAENAVSQIKGHKFIIYEFDIATDTGAYVAVSIGPQARTDPAGGGDARASSVFNVSSDGKVTQNGSLKFADGVTESALSLTEWNKVTIAIDTTAEVDSGYVGMMYVYINGKLTLSGKNAFKTGAYVQGIRFDVANYQPEGRGFLIDNLAVRAYSNTPANIDVNKFETVTAGIPTNTDSPIKSDIFVGPIEYHDISSAIAKATELGTYPSVKNDIKDFVINTDTIIFSNGHTIETAEGSYKASVIFAKDGTILGYDFKEIYSNLYSDYYWFCGDMNDPDQFLHPENDAYFKHNTFAIGEIPNAPADVNIQNNLDLPNYSEKRHIGWDYDGDGNDAVNFTPLKMEDMGKKIYLYPVFENYYFTALVYDDAGLIGYTKNDDSIANLFTILKNNPGATLKLLNDFKIEDAPDVQFTSGVYNIDFNGNTLYMNVKGNVFTATDGAELNIYSSVPGAMFYAVELAEADGSTFTGAGTFAKINDTNTASSINIGSVNTHSGKNLIIAGDTIVEAAASLAESSVNIDGATVIRVAYDKATDAVIHADGYNGKINVSNSSFILPTGSAVISNKATAKAGEAVFNNSTFIFNTNSNGTDKDIVKYATGFATLKFEGCITNGKMSASDSSVIIGSGNAAYAYDFAEGFAFADGAAYAKYNAPVNLPAISTSDFYDTEIGADGAFVTALDGGVIRVQRWGFKNGGAVPNGYLYIYPNGYTGVRYDTGVYDTAVILPVISEMITNETVTVTHKNSLDEVIATEVYAKGGNLIETVEFPASEELVAIKVINDGSWNVELPIIGLTEDLVLTPAGSKAEVKMENIKASVSLYKDFAINVYIPEAYADYITSITNGAEELARENVVINGENYIMVTVKVPSFAASRDVNFEIAVTEDSYSVTGVLTVSVADYAAKVISGEASVNDSDVKLVRYMAAYGYEAAKYFKNIDDAELKGLCGDVSDYNPKTVDISGLSSVIASITVDLGSDIGVVLKVKDDFVGTITILGNDYVIDKESDKLITITGLRFADFALELPIAATDADGNEIINSSYALLDAYTSYHIANAMAGNNTSFEAYKLVKAFFNYVQYANEYVANME